MPFNRIVRCVYEYAYNHYYKERIQKKIFKQDHVKVLFLILNLGMWKSNKLFELLLHDKRIEPYIVTSFIASDTPEYKQYVQNSIVDYFSKMNYPIITTYDPISKKCKKVKKIDADLVFYQQPYHEKVKEFHNNALFAYIPYDYPIQDDKIFHNRLYLNICWRIFAVNEKYKQFEEKYSHGKGRNVTVVGFSNSDYYFDNHIVSSGSWKISGRELKKIIWAPHHSILASDTMGQSLFLELAEDFLTLAELYKEKCQFVFKPHPRLKDKLYKLKEWGPKRTEEYYNKWRTGSNTNFIEGNYIDLFISSDAMIHDCSSFIAEYLYTSHPVLFTMKDSYDYNLSGEDSLLFDSMYKGYTIADIKAFIDNVVIEGKDPKRLNRREVLDNKLLPTDGESVCRRIYKEIQTLLP